MEQTSILKTHFELQIALLRTNRKKSAAEAVLRQAKFDLREAQQAQILYGSTIRSLMDKFSGKREEKETKLRHAVMQAEADLAAARNSVSDSQDQLCTLTQSLAALAPWKNLKTAENEAEWCRLEALYCAEAVLPLLEASLFLLQERRNQANGGNAGQIKSPYELADIYTAPEKAGDDCRPYILRLNAALETLDIRLPKHTYFLDPAVFLNTATKYTRFDRLNEAITQTEAMLRCVSALRQTLTNP